MKTLRMICAAMQPLTFAAMLPFAAAGCQRKPAAAPTTVEHRPLAVTTPPAARPAAPKADLILELGGGVTMEFVRVPAGEYLMGTGRQGFLFEEDERPEHRVTLTKPFYIGKDEVTQAQWQAVMDNNPSSYVGEYKPVHNVSWLDSAAFCKALSEKTGRTVRLPSEAQWEYACRAGSTSLYCFGDGEAELADYGWYEENRTDADGPELVGTRKPNAWGIHDMHGNVFEWCNDWYDDTYYGWCASTDPEGPQVGANRVLRGGSWYMGFWPSRSAYRSRSAPEGKQAHVGLRVVVVE